jgi:hypothetical protein
LFDLFQANRERPRTALTVHAPTLLLLDTERNRATVRREQLRDPDNARREYGAEFLALDASTFFDPRAIDEAVDRSLLLPVTRNPARTVGIGADWGFRRDSSALVVSQRDSKSVHTISAVLELRPTDVPLVPSEVVRQFAKVAHSYRVEVLMSDAHYREAIAEWLLEHDLGLMPAPDGNSGKTKTYMQTRTLLHQGLIRLPDHERLLRQLRDVQARPQSGGGLTIDVQRQRVGGRLTGGHGDIVSAMVLAVWVAARESLPEMPSRYPVEGSHEFYELQVNARKEQKIRRAKEEAEEAAWWDD